MGGSGITLYGANGQPTAYNQTSYTAEDERPDMPMVPSALDFGIRGVPSLRQSGGQIHEERLPRLMGRKAMLLYREMADNSQIVGFILRAMKTWIGAAKWRAEPARDTQPAHEAAWLVETCMQDMAHTWDDFIYQALSVIEYGFSYFEVCYKRRMGGDSSGSPLCKSLYDDGYIGWRKFALRSQESMDRWAFDDNGSLTGLWQMLPEGTVYNAQLQGRGGRFFIPLQKALLFRLNGYNDSPEGRSALRNCVTAYLDQRRISDIEMIGVERDLAGLPDMQLPAEFFSPNAPPWMVQARAVWKQVTSMIRRDELEGITRPCELDENGKPTGYKFQLLTSGGERQLDPDKIIRRKESRIAMAMLAEFCLVGIEKGAGFDGGGVMDSKKDAFSLSISSIPRSIASVLNHYAVRPLCRINGIDNADIPQIKHTDVAGPSLPEMAAYVSQLSAAGMLMYDAQTEGHLRELADLPQRDETQIGGNKITGMSKPQQQAPGDEASASGIPADPAAANPPPPPKGKPAPSAAPAPPTPPHGPTPPKGPTP